MNTRRLTVALLALLLIAAPCLADTISGRVFIDLNDDGLWQAEEPTVPGALVSDGLTIAVTGDDGMYALSSPEGEQVVFVVNPAGTWPARGFHRNVTVGPAQADFPLARQEQTVPFHFVHATDHHIRPNVGPMMARYVQAVNDLPLPIAFVVHTGDQVSDVNRTTIEQGRALFDAYKEMVADLRPPLIDLPGNHEHAAVSRDDVDPATPGWGKGLYREMMGPMHFAFNYAGVHFIAMDGTDIVDGKMVYGIPAECMEWLEAYLGHVEQGEPIVMLIHEPFNTLAQKRQVEELLGGHNVLLALSGHGRGIAYWPFAGATEIMGGAASYAWHGAGFGPNPMAYQVIRITEDGFENAFADWAAQYSLTVTTPPRAAPLTGETTVEALLFDPAEEVRAVDVEFGPQQARITDFGTRGLSRSFTVEFDAAALPDGFHDLAFTMHGEGEPFIARHPYLVVTGIEEPFEAAGPATLRFRPFRVRAANAVFVNGTEVGRMPADAPDRQWLDFEVPAEVLRRLNVIELVTARLPDDTGWNDFAVDGVEMRYEGQVYDDYRAYKYAVTRARPEGDEAGRVTFYVDLTRPR